MIETGIAFIVDASGAGIGVDKIEQQLDRIPRAAERTQKTLDSSLKNVGGAFDKVSSGIFNLKNVVAGGAFGALVKDIVDTGKSLQNLRLAFESVYGSAAAGKAQFDFVSKTAGRLGVDIESTAKGYLKFSAATKGTALEGAPTQAIFEKLTASMRALGRSSADTEGVLNAFGQMVSKGKVQAEELRGQLGDRLFGSFNTAAEAIGATTAELEEMIKAGSVRPDEFLLQFVDKISEKFPLTEKALGSFEASYTRFQNNLKLVKEKAFNSGLEESLSKVLDKLSEKLEKIDIAKFAKDAGEAITALGGALIFAVENADILVGVFKAFIALQIVTVVFNIVGAVRTLAAVMLPLAAANPFIAIGAVILGVIGYLATFTDKLDFVKKAFGDAIKWIGEMWDAAGKRIAAVIDSISNAIAKIGRGISSSLKGVGELQKTQGSAYVSQFVPFAGGGIMTSRGSVPLRKYAGGGIANSPQLAMFGEGSTPEAFVPVPNGRIPVSLKGVGNNYIVNNNNFTGGPTSDFSLPELNFGQDNQKNFFEKSKSSLEQYVESVKTGMEAVDEVASNSVQKLEDTFVSFFETGKINFKDFANSIQEDILRSFVRQSITGPIANGLSGAFSGASGGGIFGELAGLAGSFFANGGIMSSSGSVPLRRYSSGGIATSPQLAMFGEGSQNEAFVPLPDGRSIPVVTRGANNNSQNITVNMTVVTKDAESFNQSRGQIAGSLAVELSRQKARYT